MANGERRSNLQLLPNGERLFSEVLSWHKNKVNARNHQSQILFWKDITAINANTMYIRAII